MSKHSLTHYFLQSKSEDGKIGILGHSEDEETGEVYHKFLDRKKASELMNKEKELLPEYKYRICKVTETFDYSDWC